MWKHEQSFKEIWIIWGTNMSVMGISEREEEKKKKKKSQEKNCWKFSLSSFCKRINWTSWGLLNNKLQLGQMQADPETEPLEKKRQKNHTRGASLLKEENSKSQVYGNLTKISSWLLSGTSASQKAVG